MTNWIVVLRISMWVLVAHCWAHASAQQVGCFLVATLDAWRHAVVALLLCLGHQVFVTNQIHFRDIALRRFKRASVAHCDFINT